MRGFVRRGMSTNLGSERSLEPSGRKSPVSVPDVLASHDAGRPGRASEVRRGAPASKGKGPPPLATVAKVEEPAEELAESDFEADGDDGIEELEASNLLSASDPPPKSEQLVDPDDVTDAPPSERLPAAALVEIAAETALKRAPPPPPPSGPKLVEDPPRTAPASEAPPTVKADVPVREPQVEVEAPKPEPPAAEATPAIDLFSPPAPKVEVALPPLATSGETIPPPPDYDNIRVSTGSKLAFHVTEEKPPEAGAAKASSTLIGIGPKKKDQKAAAAKPLAATESEPPARVPVVDPSVYRADEIASASIPASARKSEKGKTVPIAMPRKTEKGSSESRIEIGTRRERDSSFEVGERNAPNLSGRALELDAPQEKRSNTKLMVVVAAVLVLGAGLALLGISAHDEPKKPRPITTTDVPPIVPAPVATTTTTPTVEPSVVPTPPAPTATIEAPVVTTAAPVATTPPAPVVTNAPPVANVPRTTAPAAPTASAKTPPPRGTALPPGLEFLKTDL